ncbi:MAG: DUF4139 domain-containing protein [Flavisolibacter sp.]
MRKLFFLLTFFTSIYSFSQPRQISIEPLVQEVTIFSSGAQVHRNAVLNILPGRTEISFTGLSNQLQQQSVQLKADANITLLSVQTIRDFLGQRKIELDERELLDRKAMVKDRMDEDSHLLLVYKNEEQMLIKNEEIGGQNGVKTEELKQALDLHRQRLTEVYQKQMELEKKLRDEKQQQERVNAQLLEISKKKDSVTYSVTALIDSKVSGNIKFELEYSIRDAGWYPSYDIRVEDVSKPLSLLMNANVYQRSGETWKNVTVNLSSGNPSDNATPSGLQPWFLGFNDPSVSWHSQSVPGMVSGRVTDMNGTPVSGATITLKGSQISTMADANGFFKFDHASGSGTMVVSSVGYESREVAIKPGYFNIALNQRTDHLEEVVVVGYGASRSEMEDLIGKPLQGKVSGILPVTVITQYQPVAVLYKIAEKYTLETDGKTTTIGIKNINIPALYQYFTAPRIDPSAFLTAKITDWQDYDIQSGEASLYFEGSFLGKTYLDLSQTGDTLSLSLGKDNTISVNRKLVKDFSSKKLIGGNRTEKKLYEISIRSSKKIPVNLVIEDQFPVSVTKEIDVDDKSAPGSVVDKETGIVVWNLLLEPGGEKKLQIGYSVKYPKERSIVL